MQITVIIFFIFSFFGLAFVTETTGASESDLTFDKRVMIQHGIEEIYQRYRTGPDRRRPISLNDCQKKVERYMLQSAILEHHWDRALTGRELQAQINRMCKTTMRPERLKELFSACNNDPLIVAECICRPILADRLSRTYFHGDSTIHGQSRQTVKSYIHQELKCEDFEQLGGQCNKTIFIRNSGLRDYRVHENGNCSIMIPESDWEVLKGSINRVITGHADHKNSKSVFGSWFNFHSLRNIEHVDKEHFINEPTLLPPSGTAGPLYETETSITAHILSHKSKNRIECETCLWSKITFDEWLNSMKTVVPINVSMPSYNYSIPEIVGYSCSDDTWTPIGLHKLVKHTAVWTGSEMLAWGGDIGTKRGLRYDPGTDTWIYMSVAGAPESRKDHTAVWTGSEMIIWGGMINDSGLPTNTGGRYDPITDTWHSISITGAPSPCYGHVSVWTGSEMIVWGGLSASGARYSPDSNTWSTIETYGAPSSPVDKTAVWTGSEMIVWGGTSTNGLGGRYHLGLDTWFPVSAFGAPSLRTDHTAIWSGSEMIIWGGKNGSTRFNTGARYQPDTNSWQMTTLTDAPWARFNHTSLWTGEFMIVWGGYYSSDKPRPAGIYDPVLDSWHSSTWINIPLSREYHSAVWTGSEMIVWGGSGIWGNIYDVGGGRYNPSLDRWQPLSRMNIPEYRKYHSAVWTGSEMIVWGGYASYTNLLTGGIFDPVTNTWRHVPTINVPWARQAHSAVWTGSEMVIWGGHSWPLGGFDLLGGRYDPVSDSWSSVTTIGMPVGRYENSAIAIGDEMVVWGGQNSYESFNDGGRYCAYTDTWTAIDVSNAPSSRVAHSAVWTGSEMIVWGGYENTSYSSDIYTGSRYNPSTDQWTSMTTTNHPQKRRGQAAVWTGSVMLIFGGASSMTSDLRQPWAYDPIMDDWLPLSSTGVSSSIVPQVSAWTGHEMLVWGGDSYNATCAIGGRYWAAADTWRATSLENVPVQLSYKGIWTNHELIVWGGASGGCYCADIPSPVPSLRNSALIFLLFLLSLIINHALVRSKKTSFSASRGSP